MTPILRRIASEKRAVVVLLGAALLANLLAYLFVVRPRGVKAAGAADRAAQAANARVAADREESAARALVTGKTRADEDLNAFYQKVLPGDLEAARRMTYSMLPALAEKSRVQWQARTSEIEPPSEKNARLGRLVTRMVLQGDYGNLRDFIYRVESAPEFVIIDDVALAETKPNEELTLTIRMSTYYRLGRSGV